MYADLNHPFYNIEWDEHLCWVIVHFVFERLLFYLSELRCVCSKGRRLYFTM